MPLLDRATRPLTLTAAGRLYFDLCRDVLRREEEFQAAPDEFKAQVEGTVRVASIYSIGLSEMSRLQEEFSLRFPKAQLRGVAGSGVAPVEEVLANRADAVPVNRVPWVAMGRKLKQLAVLPKDNNCQNSTEKAAPVGMAIDKNQPAFLAWTRAVEKEIESKLKADEARVIDMMK